ncbi:MAG: pseudouridine synthase [Planctomycetota bacterium]|jgi:16S rRNA pseudouridine516 synthase
MRLDAYLARSGRFTRSEAKKAIRRKRVRVDDAVTTNATTMVSETSAVSVDGETLILPPSTLHLLMHKPTGIACSRAEDEAPLVYDLLPDGWRSIVEAAGRLDRMTSGLLILSSDGTLIHRIISPKRKVAKRYRIGYRGTLHPDAVARCHDGIILDDNPRPTRPALLTLEDDDNDLHQATLILHEGRYHQVRRMIAALGGEVITLHRDRIGGLALPADLGPGEIRQLSEDDLAQLWDHSNTL